MQYLMKRQKSNIKTIIKRKIVNKYQINKSDIVIINKNEMKNSHLRRVGKTIPLENKVSEDIYFITPFEKNNDIYYDTIILITSYNRYDFVNELLNQIYTQKTEYTYKVILINDGSNDNRYNFLNKKFSELVYIKNENNLGKYLYWKTINKGLQEVKKYNTNSIIQIDDDFKLCDNYLNRLISLYYEKKYENNKILCISYHLYSEDHLIGGRWGLKYWVDGGGLYDIEFIKLIGYQIDEIPMSRWSQYKNLSTGVWNQISKKINDFNCIIYKTPVSYVWHLGYKDSKMWTGDVSGELITYNFIDEL